MCTAVQPAYIVCYVWTMSIVTVSGRALLPGDVVLAGMPHKMIRMVISVDRKHSTATWLGLRSFCVYDTLVWEETYSVLRTSA